MDSLATAQSFQKAKLLFDSAPFMDHLGANVLRAGSGWVEVELALHPWMEQQDGYIHAGIGTSLADHAMGTAAYTTMAQGYTPLSIEISVRLLRPAIGERLFCRASVVKPGRRIATVEADVWSLKNDKIKTHVIRSHASMAVVAKSDLR